MSKKTSLTRSLMAAVSIVAVSAVMYGCSSSDAPPPTDTGMEMPEPVDVTMAVALNATQQARLKDVLPNSGTSDTVTIPAGGTATRGSGLGVEFSCDSAYPCTVTVTNSLGTIMASMTTQMLPDAADPMVTASLPDPVDTFAELNDGSTASIRALMGTPAITGDNQQDAVLPTLTSTELIGMGIGGAGVLDASKAGLRSSLDPNSTDAGGAATGSGAVPGLTGGSTISSAMRPDGDGIPASDDMAMAPEGWGMQTLHRDWGDTAGDGDGGFETGAIIVNNLGDGTEHPFDRKLHDRYINTAAQAMFDLSIRADGSAPGVTTLGTSVDIDGTGDATFTATAEQWAAMVFDSASLVPAQSQDLNVNQSETFTGSYFGASGQFQCIAGNDEVCAIARNADGTVGVHDTGTAEGIQGSGRWSFTPDPGAMITVPDQDWIAYGAWLTTPDGTAGTHRIGVFFNGMDTWAPATNALTATNAAGLRGSATYTGGATGIYVDGARSGLFTAEATLTATFDKDSTGGDVAADDYMLSGRIDNFRGTDGVYLGADTQANPNDPAAGGENDWVVLLGMRDFSQTDQISATGLITGGSTSGSADGVSWSGSWNGQLFGPSSDTDGALAPSGVAGRFWAQTADPDGTGDTGGPLTASQTSVVGAFGADRD